MKRIAAVAALSLAMLAVPAAAMASTGGSGSDRPWPGQSMCPQPSQHHHRHHKPTGTEVCPMPSKNCPPGSAYGQSQSFTFDVASGSSTVYEVSGPTLAPAEEFSYGGSIYTIWSVNPGADSFTMSQGEFLFVNDGPSISNATGYLVCSG
jgi:hypothetical protein